MGGRLSQTRPILRSPDGDKIDDVVVVIVTMVSDETMAPNKETHFGLISVRQMDRQYQLLATIVGRDRQALSPSHKCWPIWTSTITQSQLLVKMDRHYQLVI